MKNLNKNLRTILVLLLAFLLSLTTACSKNDAADAYIEMAQDYVDESNYDAAIEVLEKGMSSVGSKKIEKMLNEVIELQLKDKQSDYSSYAGTWAEEGLGWELGGLLMDVEVANKVISIKCAFTQSAPDSRVAEIAMDIAADDIKENSVICEYADDGWGNSGKLKIQFNGDNVECSFLDIKESADEIPIWGFFEETYKLIKNDNAHDDLVYTMADYYALYPEENPDNWQEPQPSTASGILAQLNMTENEFRASCIFLTRDSETENGYREQYPHVSIEELIAYPNQYIGAHFVAISDFAKHIDNIIAGDMSISKFEVVSKGTKDGYFSYLAPIDANGVWSDSDMYVGIYDFRDDPYSPNITEGDEITPYMIFIGLENDIPAFQMISVDVQFG